MDYAIMISFFTRL